jgi:steroid delta-isomerase-like uncharacterized protein
MSIEENKAIARRFIQAWSAGGEAIVDELAAPTLTVAYTHWPEPVRGPAQFKQMLTETFRYFPDMKVAVDELLAETDRVMVRWTYTGTHQHGELYGLPATGKSVKVSGITVYRIADGKVVEESGLVDSFNMMLQLGARPTG